LNEVKAFKALVRPLAGRPSTSSGKSKPSKKGEVLRELPPRSGARGRVIGGGWSSANSPSPSSPRVEGSFVFPKWALGVGIGHAHQDAGGAALEEIGERLPRSRWCRPAPTMAVSLPEARLEGTARGPRRPFLRGQWSTMAWCP